MQKKPRSFIKDVYRRLSTNFPVRSNIIILVVMIFLGVLVCLLSSCLLIMIYQNSIGHNSVYRKFQIKDKTNVTKNITFYEEFKIFNTHLMGIRGIDSVPLAVVIILSMVTLLLGALSLLFKWLILFVIVLLLTIIFGSIIMWLSNSMIKFNFTSSKELFAYLLFKYNPRYDCYYKIDFLIWCKFTYDWKVTVRNNYSEQVGQWFNEMGCCGYSSWTEFTRLPLYYSWPLFCCPYGGESCPEDQRFPPCAPKFNREINNSNLVMAVRVVSILCGVLLIIMALIALCHLLFICSPDSHRMFVNKVCVEESSVATNDNKKDNETKEVKRPLIHNDESKPIERKPESKSLSKPVYSKPEDKLPITPIASKPEDKQPIKPVDSKPDDKQPIKPVDSKPDYKQPITPVDSKPDDKQPIKPVASKPEDKQPIISVDSKSANKHIQPKSSKGIPVFNKDKYKSSKHRDSKQDSSSKSDSDFKKPEVQRPFKSVDSKSAPKTTTKYEDSKQETNSSSDSKKNIKPSTVSVELKKPKSLKGTPVFNEDRYKSSKQHDSKQGSNFKSDK